MLCRAAAALAAPRRRSESRRLATGHRQRDPTTDMRRLRFAAHGIELRRCDGFPDPPGAIERLERHAEATRVGCEVPVPLGGIASKPDDVRREQMRDPSREASGGSWITLPCLSAKVLAHRESTEARAPKSTSSPTSPPRRFTISPSTDAESAGSQVAVPIDLSENARVENFGALRPGFRRKGFGRSRLGRKRHQSLGSTGTFARGAEAI